MNEVAVFALTGTGAPITVKCGFVPAVVEVQNIDSTGGESLKWFRGMPDASAIKRTNTAQTRPTTNGITPVGVGNASAVEKGFIIGADADVNASGEKMIAVAYRGGPGNQF